MALQIKGGTNPQPMPRHVHVAGKARLGIGKRPPAVKGAIVRRIHKGLRRSPPLSKPPH